MEVKNFIYKLLEPVPEKRVPLEKMYEDPWFQTDSDPVTLPNSRVSAPDNAGAAEMRGSVFLNAPTHHTYNTEEGVTILDADTEAISYSRNVFPLPDSTPGKRVTNPTTVATAGPAPKVQKKKSSKPGGDDDTEIPLTGVWSKAGRLSKEKDEAEDNKKKSRG